MLTQEFLKTCPQEAKVLAAWEGIHTAIKKPRTVSRTCFYRHKFCRIRCRPNLKKKESKMKLVKCRRNGNKIITLGLDKANSTKTYASVNQAKRESRKLQIAVGGLGCGVLEVV